MTDWAVGDKAVQVARASCGSCGGGPVDVPGVLTVTVVRPFANEPPGLDFVERPAATFTQWLYCACQFRKIRPDEHESCEPEFVTLLKRVKVPALLSHETADQIRKWRAEDEANGMPWEMGNE